MSILASDIITIRARGIIGKALSDEYPSDEKPLAFLNDALRMLYSKRPDSAYDSDDVYYDPVPVTAIGQSIHVSEKWIPFLTDYVCARWFQLDGENPAHRERANECFEQAKENLTV